MTYDPELAANYDQDLHPGLSLKEVWFWGKGTCREFAMVMAELCQTQAIPVRFVQGISAPDRLHVWNEVYFDSTGWIAVDVQSGLIGYWGNLVTFQIEEKIQALPMPSALKLKMIKPLAIQQDRQVYLQFKKRPKALVSSGQFLLKSWQNELGVRCLVHLQTQYSLPPSWTTLTAALNEQIASFPQAELLASGKTKIDDTMEVLERLCQQFIIAGYSARLAAGLDCNVGQLAVWLEIAVSEKEWMKWDIASKTLGYQSHWIRFSTASSREALISELRESSR